MTPSALSQLVFAIAAFDQPPNFILPAPQIEAMQRRLRDRLLGDDGQSNIEQ